MKIEPYLHFGGTCEEALNFYRDVLGARIDMIMRFSESPEPLPPGMVPPGSENHVMHASFRIGDSKIMASDGCGPKDGFTGFSLSVAVTTEEEAERAFSALAQGGEVGMPLARTFWSPRFGMVTDKFGVNWMVNMVAPGEAM